MAPWSATQLRRRVGALLDELLRAAHMRGGVSVVDPDGRVGFIDLGDYISTAAATTSAADNLESVAAYIVLAVPQWRLEPYCPDSALPFVSAAVRRRRTHAALVARARATGQWLATLPHASDDFVRAVSGW